MNAVIVDDDVSYPATSGKRRRTLHLMLRLAARHRITYIARGQGDAGQDRQAVDYLERHGVEAKIIDDPVARKGPAFYVRLAGHLFSPRPCRVALHHSEKFRAAVFDHAANHPVDLYQLEWAGYLFALPPGRVAVVLQAPTVDSLVWQRYHEAEKRPFMKWYLRSQWQKFLAFEREAFRAARHVVAATLEDAALLSALFGVDRVEVVDNGVDIARYRDLRPRDDSRAILFPMALGRGPSLDAFNLLLDAVFPAVRALVPEARLVIVGGSPPERSRRKAARQQGVELHSGVEDVQPFLVSSAVMAVPPRAGGGVRLKVLEALAAGLPVVSTRAGAEGLAIRPGQDFTLADTPEELTRALVACLQHPDRARRQAEQGRLTVAGRYDWSTLADRLERVWEKARAGTDAAVRSV